MSSHVFLPDDKCLGVENGYLDEELAQVEVTVYSRMESAACPVGAISSDGSFNFSSCFTHNYREFMSGFTDWVEDVADEKPAKDYRAKHSDAEAYANKRFPHKPTKQVGSVLRPTTIEGFIRGMQHVFQPGKSSGLNARYHFRFTGSEPAQCTVQIQDSKIEGHQAYPSILDLPLVPEALSIITPPVVTRKVVADAIAAGVKHIWMQPGAEDDQASESAREAGITVIDDGKCILVLLARV